jgi:hypothetical protein
VTFNHGVLGSSPSALTKQNQELTSLPDPVERLSEIGSCTRYAQTGTSRWRIVFIGYVILAAAGYNFGLLLRWLAELLRVIIQAFIETVPAQNIA